MNMVLHAKHDRASESTSAIYERKTLRDFTAKLQVAPPRLNPAVPDDAHTAWPVTFRVGTPQTTRLDYHMLPTYHTSASRGVATWTARCIHTDHSVFMLTFCRSAALGKLPETDRRHRLAGARNVTLFMSALEAGPTWNWARTPNGTTHQTTQKPRRKQHHHHRACRHN